MAKVNLKLIPNIKHANQNKNTKYKKQKYKQLLFSNNIWNHKYEMKCARLFYKIVFQTFVEYTKKKWKDLSLFILVDELVQGNFCMVIVLIYLFTNHFMKKNQDIIVVQMYEIVNIQMHF
jgi:hypothetical protein